MIQRRLCNFYILGAGRDIFREYTAARAPIESALFEPLLKHSQKLMICTKLCNITTHIQSSCNQSRCNTVRHSPVPVPHPGTVALSCWAVDVEAYTYTDIRRAWIPIHRAAHTKMYATIKLDIHWTI